MNNEELKRFLEMHAQDLQRWEEEEEEKERRCREVKHLLGESWRLYAAGDCAQALRCAEKARACAQAAKSVAMEVHATGAEGAALLLLGCPEEALARYAWILGIAADPEQAEAIAGVSFAVIPAFAWWVEAALRVPSITVAELHDVLDAGERFVWCHGVHTWLTTIHATRAHVFEALGQREKAIRYAEEAMAFKRRDPRAPGVSLGSLQVQLGNLLREAGRTEEAKVLYEAARDDRRSTPNDRFQAFVGLCGYAQLIGDTIAARTFAEEALRLAEPISDQVLSRALEALFNVYLQQGDFPSARRASDRLILLARRLGGSEGMHCACLRGAQMALLEGDAACARALLDEAQPHTDALDHARNRVHYRAEMDNLRAELAKLEATRSTPSDG